MTTPAARRLLLADAPDLPPLPRLDLTTLGALLDDAGLTGRGGSGFPTGRKLASIAAAGPRAVVVGNAMEGEPLSHKDRVLLQRSPGLVVDGLTLVGDALGARTRLLAVDVAHRIPPGVVGRPGVEVRPMRGGYVAGQESALVNQLDGRPALPSDPLRPVRERGVGGRPTLVLNAETLAQVSLLARLGPDWFRTAGTATDPGTFLVTLSGSDPGLVATPGVVEVERGVPLREVLALGGVELDLAGPVLVGGYHGQWVSDLDRPLTRDADGVAPGAGVVHVLHRDRCPVATTADIADYLAASSVRQCGPCLNGLPHLAGLVHRLARPDGGPGLAVEVDRIRRQVTGRGACAHPDGTARLVGSLLTELGDHVAGHLAGPRTRRCRQ